MALSNFAAKIATATIKEAYLIVSFVDGVTEVWHGGCS
jgi:hypothetical protein